MADFLEMNQQVLAELEEKKDLLLPSDVESLIAFVKEEAKKIQIKNLLLDIEDDKFTPDIKSHLLKLGLGKEDLLFRAAVLLRKQCTRSAVYRLLVYEAYMNLGGK